MARPRRTRYRFTATPPRGEDRRIDVLAYTREAAIQRLERSGWTNIEHMSRERKVTPAAAAAWKLNEANLREAIEFLGVKWPVLVKLTGHQGGRHGAHQLREDRRGPYHHITIKNYLDPERAGRVVWHELSHAMQCERVAAAAGATGILATQQAWSKTPERRGSYYSRPIEVEARSYERFNDELSLATRR